MCFRWVFQFADEKVLKQPAVHLHRGQTVCQSLFSEKPAPLSNYRRQKNYTAAVSHKDNILCNAVQCAHLRSEASPQAKETHARSVFQSRG